MFGLGVCQASLLAGSSGRARLDVASSELCGAVSRRRRDVETMLLGLEQLAVARDLRVQVDLDVVQLLVLSQHFVDLFAQLCDLGLFFRDVLVVAVLRFSELLFQIYY